VFLCATTASYRQFYASGLGLVVVIAGAVASTAGFALVRRLARPIATTERVFTTSFPPAVRGVRLGERGPT
jgi:drug/metabolite transporter (DMT)-like permease